MLNIYKPVGLSPLDVIKELQANSPFYAKQKLAYAGRLDPLADGVLIILEGEETKDRISFQKLPKAYTCEILLGIETDTYDSLGLITEVKECSQITLKKIEETLSFFKGIFFQTYPPYSSPRVKGKPLFWWAREKKLHEIKLPQKQVEVTSIIARDIKEWEAKKLHNFIFNRISLISGEFRQEEIKDKWEKFFSENPNKTLISFTLDVECSSGTYMRSLAYEIGRKLDCGAIALTITRTRVGEFTLKHSLDVGDVDDPVR